MTDTLPDDPHRRADADASERARIAGEQLSRVNGPLELHAAVLALMLPPGSRRAVRAWRIECKEVPTAQALREQIAFLPGAARLPWFEVLLARMRGRPLPVRQSLLAATRRVMGARGVIRPIDRLHWLVMRQRLGEAVPVSQPAGAETTMSELPQADVHAIAMFTAFLSRMVPVDAAEAEPTAAEGAATQDSRGAAWYATAMAPWAHREGVPPHAVPDTDGLVYALRALQAMPWMQRPVLVRAWVTAARQHSRYGQLNDGAADALRLSCSLLDSPLPPELARHYSAFTPEVAP